MSGIARAIALAVVVACAKADDRATDSTQPAVASDSAAAAEESDIRSDIAAKRALWTQTRPRAYAFEYQLTCDCPGGGVWWRVEVRDGAVASATPSPAGIARPDGGPYTVDAIFDDILERAGQNPDQLGVAFDARWRYPAWFSVDPDIDATDDEREIEIRAFTPLT